MGEIDPGHLHNMRFAPPPWSAKHQYSAVPLAERPMDWMLSQTNNVQEALELFTVRGGTFQTELRKTQAI
jgi:hypothetical protein